MHLQDQTGAVKTVLRGLPRLRCVVMGSFLFVFVSVTMGGATGPALQDPKRRSTAAIHIRYEAENIASGFGRNGSSLFVAQ